MLLSCLKEVILRSFPLGGSSHVMHLASTHLQRRFKALGLSISHHGGISGAQCHRHLSRPSWSVASLCAVITILLLCGLVTMHAWVLK